MGNKEQEISVAESVLRTQKAWLAVLPIFAVLTLAAAEAPLAQADQKVFSGTGDGTSWHDAGNWFTGGVPSAIDGVTINKSNLAVVVPDDFIAQSIVVAGKAVSNLTIEPFVYGTITPPTPSDPALYIRKDGTVVLSGAGIIVMKGSFKNSEEQLATESSVMILLQ